MQVDFHILVISLADMVRNNVKSMWIVVNFNEDAKTLVWSLNYTLYLYKQTKESYKQLKNIVTLNWNG